MSRKNIPPGPGRPKGLKNSFTRDLAALCDTVGYDPAVALIHIAMDMRNPLMNRQRAHEKLLDKMYPDFSRIQLSGDKEAPVGIVINWDDKEPDDTN